MSESIEYLKDPMVLLEMSAMVLTCVYLLVLLFEHIAFRRSAYGPYAIRAETLHSVFCRWTGVYSRWGVVGSNAHSLYKRWPNNR